MTKLYHHPDQGWTVPGQQPAKAARMDVPNNPEALAAWLNQRRVPFVALAPGAVTPGALDEAGDPYPSAGAEPGGKSALDAYVEREFDKAKRRALQDAEARAVAAARSIETNAANAIAEWIFAASPDTVERLFGALGARFHELRKEAGR